MIDINSLPDSLREQIQESASALLPTRNGERAAPSDPVQSVILELARQSPELFVAMLLDTTRFCGVETVETEETSEDRVVDIHASGRNAETVVCPMKSSRTIRRQVRFISEERSTIRSRR